MQEISEENSYRTILKRLSAFGGVQIFSILANLVRGKFAALFLGPTGMGVSALFNNAATTLQQFAGLGLNMSIVKEVAATRNDEDKHHDVLSVALRLIILTSLAGALICLVLSPFLSEWTFGNRDYTSGFVLLSVGVAFSIAGVGLFSILQGRNEVKRLIYASLVGSLTGLFAGVPLYYFFGVKGIVPASVLIFFTIFLFYYISFRKSVKYRDIPFEKSQHLPIVKKLISLGLIFMAGMMASSATAYLMNIYIRHMSSITEVGLYQAASSLTSQYVAVLLAALAMDYFPRLSAASNNHNNMRVIANRQTEVVMLIACPMTLIVIAAAPLGVHLLLTAEFLPAVTLIRLLALSVFEQALIFPLGYYFLAKENKKLYIWLETVITNVSWIILCIVLFPLYGLVGLGIGQLIRCLIDLALNIYFCRRCYGFYYDSSTLKIIIISLTAGVAGFSLSMVEGSLICTIGAWSIIAISSVFAVIMLRRRITNKQDLV